MIDPCVHRCKCGVTFCPGVFHKVVMLVFGCYSWKCPQCGTVMRFRLIHHVVKVDMEVVKGRERLWRNS